TGPNKFRLIDYLNASVVVREKDQLERKNLFATNTIRFIDSSLVSRGVDLEDALQELNRFKNNNLDVSLEGGLELLSGRLKSFDNQKDGAAKKLEYYEILEEYLTTRKDYSSVPAPSVAGISESSISGCVSRIVALSVQRSTYAFSAKEDNPIFAELDRNINAEKVVLLENIRSSKSLIDREMQQIDADIREAERELKKYPAEEQKLTEIERKFSLSQAAFNLYEAKRSEAEIIKASNVSDLLFIDPAKDVGVGPIGPNMRLNYMMAALIGGVIPIALAFLIVFFDTKIGNPEEIKKLSQIPVLGVVGKSKHNNNLIVRDQPKSAISEAFRGIRSGLQFLYKTKKLEGAKTVLVTSSVSGEGKTFTSINIASVFALSGKKTVLVGLDLRKPKIFDDFELTNDMGVVNYLIGQSTLSEIRQDSGISHLDIILAGPIPPNPSELLISDRMKMFMDELKANYDYIILDTPPVGLVSDALEVLPYADATIYMVRQGYTKKNMLGLINEKYRNGEVKNVSFVLNYFRTKGRYGYGSGYGYGYGYGNYSNGYHEEQRSGGVLKKMSRKFRSLFRYKK
ncbi:MAG: capsular exopolysaccharide synthesis family protein, partial [Dokdonia sp.]